MDSVEAVKSLEAERPLGFVPTMGYLHEGHLSLLRLAREECASVVLSIFVNPLQFGPAEDLARYPRDEERDVELAREVGVDAVFVPPVEEMYPEGFTTEVRVQDLEDLLEGAARPGHFTGVATVLAKLLNLVGPDRMYLGQKDAQQAILVRRMIRDLGFPTQLVVCPTVRDPDGLAMSSRNVYLGPEERTSATVLYKALSEARESSERNPRKARRARQGHHRRRETRQFGIRLGFGCRFSRPGRVRRSGNPAFPGGCSRRNPAHRQRRDRLEFATQQIRITGLALHNRRD